MARKLPKTRQPLDGSTAPGRPRSGFRPVGLVSRSELLKAPKGPRIFGAPDRGRRGTDRGAPLPVKARSSPRSGSRGWGAGLFRAGRRKNGPDGGAAGLEEFNYSPPARLSTRASEPSGPGLPDRTSMLPDLPRCHRSAGKELLNRDEKRSIHDLTGPGGTAPPKKARVGPCVFGGSFRPSGLVGAAGSRKSSSDGRGQRGVGAGCLGFLGKISKGDLKEGISKTQHSQQSRVFI